MQDSIQIVWLLKLLKYIMDLDKLEPLDGLMISVRKLWKKGLHARVGIIGCAREDKNELHLWEFVKPTTLSGQELE